jgi:DNA (cytosine-5)-methyltransferase 1
MRLLDLCCCEGGAWAGYTAAGFDVVGVDRVAQPRYPGVMHVADAREYLREHGREFDAIHASTPCQPHMTGGQARRGGEDREDILAEVRGMLDALGKPYIMENVEGAPLRRDVVLCGSMFGRPLRRHRVFELGGWQFSKLLPQCDHSKPVVGVYGHPHGKAGAWPTMLPSTLESWREAIGAPWMSAHGLAESIPPDYTELLGRNLLEQMRDMHR